MDVACLVSGGKDSLYALYRAHKEGHLIKCLLTMIPENDESYMFHFPNTHLVGLQAECLGIPLLKKKTQAKKEKELEDLASLMRNLPVSGIVSGAIASSYQKERIDALCRDLGFESLTPLWEREPEKILKDMLGEGFEIIITGVAADRLDESFLGKTLFEAKEKILRLSESHGIHLLGEGGEYETFVCDMPLFKERIVVEEAKVMWKGNAGTYIIERAKTVTKTF